VGAGEGCGGWGVGVGGTARAYREGRVQGPEVGEDSWGGGVCTRVGRLLSQSRAEAVEVVGYGVGRKEEFSGQGAGKDTLWPDGGTAQPDVRNRSQLLWTKGRFLHPLRQHVRKS